MLAIVVPTLFPLFEKKNGRFSGDNKKKRAIAVGAIKLPYLSDMAILWRREMILGSGPTGYALNP